MMSLQHGMYDIFYIFIKESKNILCICKNKASYDYII